MIKNIVLCSDGTGNSGGKGRGTNVWQLYKSLDLNANQTEPDKYPQVAFHDDGVGTNNLKILGGALGLGLKKNIRDLYIFLCRIYEPGDQIFIFGFSRGAYTARALAAMIAQCGIIDAKKCSDTELVSLSKLAISILRKNFRTKISEKFRGENWIKKCENNAEEAANDFRIKYAVHDPVHLPDCRPEIRFVGVWDTVDAYGLPWDGLTDFIHFFIYPFKFPNRKLSKQVISAAHAIAIDDERHTFHPELWDETNENSDRINQVWFAGVHSNVGGGYPKNGMALVSLDWMLTQAEKTIDDQHPGLHFINHKRNEIRVSANVYDKQYDSRAGLMVYYRYNPRDIDEISNLNGIKTPKIHVSALYRAAQHIGGYAPCNLPPNILLVSTEHVSGNPDVPESKLDALSKAYSAVSNGEKLLDKIKFGVLIRRFLHHALIFITIALLFFASRSSIYCPAANAPHKWIDKLNGIFESVPLIGDLLFTNIIKPLFVCPNIGFIVIGIMVVIWLIGITIKSWMHKISIRFWDAVFSRIGIRKT